MAKKQQENKQKHEDISGLFIPAGIFLGTGLGFLLDNLPAWLFIGMAVGFIAMVLSKKKKEQ